MSTKNISRCECCRERAVLSCGHGPALNFCEEHFLWHMREAHGYTRDEAVAEVNEILYAREEPER